MASFSKEYSFPISINVQMKPGFKIECEPFYTSGGVGLKFKCDPSTDKVNAALQDLVEWQRRHSDTVECIEAFVND